MMENDVCTADKLIQNIIGLLSFPQPLNAIEPKIATLYQTEIELFKSTAKSYTEKYAMHKENLIKNSNINLAVKKQIIENDKIQARNVPEPQVDNVSLNSEEMEAEIYAHIGTGNTNTYGFGSNQFSAPESAWMSRYAAKHSPQKANQEQFMLEYMSWDVIQRETQPKLNDLEQIIQSQILQKGSPNSDFFKNNSFQYQAPFTAFYRNIEDEQILNAVERESNLSDDLTPRITLNDLMIQMGIPHQDELVQFYQNYMQAKFSANNISALKPIILMGHKLFVINYTEQFIFATDGLKTENGVSALIVTLFGNQFLVKTFSPKENYSKILSALLELQEIL